MEEKEEETLTSLVETMEEKEEETVQVLHARQQLAKQQLLTLADMFSRQLTDKTTELQTTLSLLIHALQKLKVPHLQAQGLHVRPCQQLLPPAEKAQGQM